MATIDHNADTVAAWTQGQRAFFGEQVEHMLDRATQRTEQKAKKEVPVDTGDLRASLDTEGHSVFSGLDYAPHVGLGTIYQDRQDYLWGPAAEILDEELERLAKSL